MYSPSSYGMSEPSLSSVKALGIVKQNKAYFTKIVYRVLFSIILSFLFKHCSMNHFLPFLVCGASSEDSLLSGQILALKSLLVRRNETQRNNERCEKLFSCCYRGTLK